jgi:hypothetical protein
MQGVLPTTNHRTRYHAASQTSIWYGISTVIEDFSSNSIVLWLRGGWALPSPRTKKAPGQNREPIAASDPRPGKHGPTRTGGLYVLSHP